MPRDPASSSDLSQTNQVPSRVATVANRDQNPSVRGKSTVQHPELGPCTRLRLTRSMFQIGCCKAVLNDVGNVLGVNLSWALSVL